MPRDPVLEWLLAGDPSIRWQTLRDLGSASAISVRRERARVARHGWGARLLALQDPDGRWKAAKGYAGRTVFDLEAAGEPGRWNTLRAMRVRNGGMARDAAARLGRARRVPVLNLPAFPSDK
jgi:hypothetical protein